MTRTCATLAHSIFGAVLAAGLLTAAPSASAQQTATVTVPFAFSVNHQSLPAGSYKVDMSSPAFVTLIDRNSAKVAGTFLVRNETGRAIETRGRLTFRRAGNRMTLTQVYVAGSNLHGELAPASKVHREQASADAASRQPVVEIATK